MSGVVWCLTTGLWTKVFHSDFIYDIRGSHQPLAGVLQFSYQCSDHDDHSVHRHGHAVRFVRAAVVLLQMNFIAWWCWGMASGTLLICWAMRLLLAKAHVSHQAEIGGIFFLHQRLPERVAIWLGWGWCCHFQAIPDAGALAHSSHVRALPRLPVELLVLNCVCSSEPGDVPRLALQGHERQSCRSAAHSDLPRLRRCVGRHFRRRLFIVLAVYRGGC